MTCNTHIVLLVLPVVSQLHHPVATLAQHPDQSEVSIRESLLTNHSSPVKLVLVKLHIVPELLTAGSLGLLQGLPLDPDNQSEVRIEIINQSEVRIETNNQSEVRRETNNQSQTWERSRVTRKARRRARR